MRKIVVAEFLTLDGVMEDPGGGPFKFSGWTWPYGNEESMKVKREELFSSDALLLGQVTYEGFAKAWPTMKDAGDFGERINSIAKYVVSDSLKTADWSNSRILRGNIPEKILKPKQEPGKDILVNGSGALVQTLMQHDLVDEYRLMVYPIVLGAGKHLFKEGTQAKMKLITAKIFETGVVLLQYRPDRDTKNK